MEQIRAAFSTMDKEQRARLDQEQTTVAAKAARVTMISWAGSLLSGLLVLACGACALLAMHGRGKAEEKLGRLLGSMPDALVIVNTEGKIVGTNAHTGKLFGYSDRELQGESMALLVPERFRKTQRQYYTAFFSRAAAGFWKRRWSFAACTRNGREFPIEVSTKPLAAEKGLVVTSAIRDITERKQVEQQVSKLKQRTGTPRDGVGKRL